MGDLVSIIYYAYLPLKTDLPVTLEADRDFIQSSGDPRSKLESFFIEYSPWETDLTALAYFGNFECDHQLPSKNSSGMATMKISTQGDFHFHPVDMFSKLPDSTQPRYRVVYKLGSREHSPRYRCPFFIGYGCG